MSKKIRTEAVDYLFSAILSLKDKEECYTFFEERKCNFKMNENYRYKTTPIAPDNAIIKGDKYRITVLTEQMLRLEYSEDGVFEDRATQTAINRCFDVPEFTVFENDGLLTITTEHIELTYNKNEPFLPTTLKLCYRGKNSNVGIIFLTAKTQEQDKVEGFRAGADDYVSKPFSPSELMARVDALYRRVAMNSPKNENELKNK